MEIASYLLAKTPVDLRGGEGRSDDEPAPEQIDKAEPPVAIPRGFGAFEAATPRSRASGAVRNFLAKTFVHCKFKSAERCPMRSVADRADVHYVDTHDGRAPTGARKSAIRRGGAPKPGLANAVEVKTDHEAITLRRRTETKVCFAIHKYRM